MFITIMRQFPTLWIFNYNIGTIAHSKPTFPGNLFLILISHKVSWLVSLFSGNLSANYRKNPKYSGTQIFFILILKFEQCGLP